MIWRTFPRVNPSCGESINGIWFIYFYRPANPSNVPVLEERTSGKDLRNEALLSRFILQFLVGMMFHSNSGGWTLICVLFTPVLKLKQLKQLSKDKDITESVGDHHTIIVYHCCLPLQYFRLILNIPCFYHILPCDYPNMYITMRKFRGIDGIDS